MTPNSFFKENWFKFGIVVALIIAAYGYYQSAVVIPRERIQAENARQMEQAAMEQRKNDEKQSNLTVCLSETEDSYSKNWNGSCKALGKLSQQCETLTLKTSIGLLGTGYSTYKEWHPGATYTDFAQAREECSCSLPAATAKRWDETQLSAKQECYQRYQ